MNNAHTTHFTDPVDPGVKHVLRGWAEAEGRPPGPAQPDIAYRDMRFWNIPTHVRQWGDHARMAGTSLFAFEVAGSCICPSRPPHHPLTHHPPQSPTPHAG